MENTEIQDITKEAATKDLDILIKEGEFIQKSGLPKELATLIYAAYRKGVEAYQNSFWKVKDDRDSYKSNYEKLAVSLADMIIGKKQNINLPF